MNLTATDGMKEIIKGQGSKKLWTVHCRAIKSIGIAAVFPLLMILLGSPACAQKRPPHTLDLTDAQSIAFKSETVVNDDRIYLRNILAAPSDPKLVDNKE